MYDLLYEENYFFIACILGIANGAVAQVLEWQIPDSLNEGWRVVNIEADELRGNEACKALVFENEEGKFSFKSNDPTFFSIRTKNGLFKVTYFDIYSFISATYGVYDKDGNLIGKDAVPLDFNRDNFDTAFFIKKLNRKHNRQMEKLLAYLVSANGYVRFLIGLYGGGELDFRVKCMNK